MQTKVKIEWFSPFGAIADKAIECAEIFFDCQSSTRQKTLYIENNCHCLHFGSILLRDCVYVLFFFSFWLTLRMHINQFIFCLTFVFIIFL